MSDVVADPWSNCFFSLELEGEEVAHFLEFSGLQSTAEVFTIEEGGLNGHVHKRPAESKWGNITLKYATTTSTRLMEWRDELLQDKFDKRPTTTVAVVLRGEDGSEIRRYSFVGCWPVSWEGPQLNSGGSDLAIETIEMAFDSVYLGDPPTPEPPAPVEPPPKELKTMEPVQFEFDSAKLTDEGKETVGEVADQLDDHPEIETLFVEGHTCDMGSHSYNQNLSQQRAQSVANELKKQKPDRNYVPMGFSYDFPVAPNNSSGNRAKNRRTQFWTEPRTGLRSGEIPYKSYK